MGIRPTYPGTWSAAQCQNLAHFRMLIGLGPDGNIYVSMRQALGLKVSDELPICRVLHRELHGNELK
jgi:hypothetical protein